MVVVTTDRRAVADSERANGSRSDSIFLVRAEINRRGGAVEKMDVDDDAGEKGIVLSRYKDAGHNSMGLGLSSCISASGNTPGRRVG